MITSCEEMARRFLSGGRLLDLDPDARHRLLTLTGGQTMAPVLVEDGRVTEIGWRGHGCFIAPDGAAGESCGR